MAYIIGTNGNDTLSAKGSLGNNILSGSDGNDYLDISGSELKHYNNNELPYITNDISKGDNTLYVQ